MSYLDLKYDVSLPEYYRLYAEALDSIEIKSLERHNLAVSIALAFHKPKKLKWKWSSLDHAGTRSIGNGKIGNGLIAALAQVASDTRSQAIKGNASEFVKATGRLVLYKVEDGTLIDHNGQEFTSHIIPKDSLIIPAKRKKRASIDG